MKLNPLLIVYSHNAILKGIGTSDPTANLEVVGKTILTSDKQYALLVRDLNNPSKNIFHVNGQAQVVGIGQTANPSFELSVLGGTDFMADDANANFQVRDASGSQVLWLGLENGLFRLNDGNNSSSSFSIRALGKGTAQSMFFDISDGANHGDFSIQGASGNEFRLKGSSGNVGLGTANPQYKLHIEGGDLRVEGEAFVNEFQFWEGGTHITPFNGATKYVITAMDNLGNATWENIDNLVSAGASVSGTVGQTQRHNGTDWEASSLLYNNATNIGIGTTNPGYKLEVAGDFEAVNGDYRLTLDGATIFGTAPFSGAAYESSTSLYYNGVADFSSISSAGLTGFMGAINPVNNNNATVTTELTGASIEYVDEVNGISTALKVAAGEAALSAEDASEEVKAGLTLTDGFKITGKNVSGSVSSLVVEDVNSDRLFEVINDGQIVIGSGAGTASTLLEVNGLTTTQEFRMSTGATDGYILQSNASGDASWVDIASVVSGLVGPTGPAGADGVDGAIGPQGPTGPTGPLVAGTANQTLHHNGIGWVASNVIENNGTEATINGDLTVDGQIKSSGGGYVGISDLNVTNELKIGTNSLFLGSQNTGQDNYIRTDNGDLSINDGSLGGGSNYDVIINANGSTGKVGIGTGAPDFKLTVAGEQKIYSHSGSNNVAVLEMIQTKNGTANNQILRFVPHLSDAGYTALAREGDFGIIWTDTETGAGRNLNSGLILAPQVPNGVNNAGLRIDSDGNVSIGTYDHNDAMLAVKGNIKAKEVEVTLTGWADFVFEAGYDLPTLLEVEDFIDENGHLPNVPSETTVVENGVNLGEMDAILLQKIEELTLYTLEQEKQLQELKSQVRKLSAENK